MADPDPREEAALGWLELLAGIAERAAPRPDTTEQEAPDA